MPRNPGSPPPVPHDPTPAQAPAPAPAPAPAADSPLGLLEVDLGPSVRAVFTTRTGGTSQGHWDGLNLARHVEDDEARVEANRRRLVAELGAPVVWATQVHGSRAATLPDGGAVPESAGEADALVTSRTDVALGVLVADCVPVLLADPEARVVATAHAGRRGLAAGVVENAVAGMVERGARAYRVRAAVGPAAGGCCYEVPESMRDDVAALVPAAAATTRRGTPSLHLAAGVTAVLRRLGADVVTNAGICTVDDDRFYSYRRAAGQPTGRFAGVVRLLP